MKSNNLLENDLDYIITKTLVLWEELKGQRIFITGGTGFFGSWLLESFSWANKTLHLNAEAVILTRNPLAFSKKCPHLFSDPAIHFHEGDILNFKYPDGKFSFIIHAALNNGSKFNGIDELSVLGNIVDGTKYILEFAKYCSVKKILFISSGAAYGNQSSSFSLSENMLSQFDSTNLRSSYALGKFMAEYLCNLYAKQYSFSIKIARCFAFVGPYIPLDLNFAIGNFILNRLNNEEIVLRSDGSSCRSYLYMADLTLWLWTILFRGKNLFPYNVGSDQKITILELAKLVADIKPKLNIKIKNRPCDTAALSGYYVPDITHAREDLNLVPTVGLLEAINLTIRWFNLKGHVV